MSEKDTDFDDEFALFKQEMKGVKKLSQDTIESNNPKRIYNKKKLLDLS